MISILTDEGTRLDLNELTILFQDEYYVAVDKPAGMVVHRGSNHEEASSVLLQSLRDQIGRRVYPVHRLDQPTSGVILFGLNPSAAAAMVEQFTHRRVAKYYQALVRGWMHRDAHLRIPLAVFPLEANETPMPIELARQSAETEFSAIRWYELPRCVEFPKPGRFTLVEAHPRTGRWHQIRRHLKHIAHPIIGDYRHGDDRYNKWFQQNYGFDRMLLAACLLSFQHPFSQEWISIRAPRGPEFDAVLTSLGTFEILIDLERLPSQPISQRSADELR